MRDLRVPGRRSDADARATCRGGCVSEATRPGAPLAAYAAHDEQSRGRRFPEPAPEFRGEFQRDRDRIIHSNAFRRLVYKTQVFVNHEGDLYRTRITHSVEVAQIARSVALALRLNEALTEAISLAHDLGHTPFGHAGQDALNECMRDYGGFEHNLQSLRVVDELEERYAEFPGLNLTFECREGILKHCSLRNARQLGELGERFIHRRQPGLEAQIANLADEIAYNNHDVDDGIRAQLLTIESLREVRMFRRQHDAVVRLYPDLGERRLVHETIRRMVNYLVSDFIRTTQAQIDLVQPQSIDDVRAQARSLAMLSEECEEEHQQLKSFLREHVYRHYKVLRMTSKARRVLQQLFEAFLRDVNLMPTEHRDHAIHAEGAHGASGRARAVSDYIAGMTDRYAILEHRRLFEPAERT
ncbi:MAG: deoxyguanosinetriphosphate triphosphohydrolase [Proteobacteria bacterium]|nr:deoxyguanosinetriphosphate triphosphohydrolase [Pseudomonadota bacterium]